MSSDTFDHTSILRFIERRFGAEVPNLTAWRRGAVGDLTSALNLAARPDLSVPALPPTQPVDPATLVQCVQSGSGGSVVGIPAPPYPVPLPQVMPGQEPGNAGRPSGCG